jgi:hypothetical protein
MKDFLKTFWLPITFGVVYVLLFVVAFWVDTSNDRRKREGTVTSGAILGGVPVEQLMVRTYSVTRTLYLDADGREVFRTESAYEIKE